MDYVTREAREASFAPPTKRSKAGWPHTSPTPAALAKAGFYYKPSTSKDNVECFTCARNLDGWEEEDDAIQEHLKHGSDCAWALLMSIEAEREHDPSNMEDPTGEHLLAARRTTFNSGWPHESKRGWVCKIEKMTEAGWYFAPTAESEDFVSCTYCKLSLDGWEPKDDPFDEHYRRSSQCPFFVFAGTAAPSKRPKAKKGRASKASRTSKASTRLSTQSNATLLSQSESIPDLEQSLDASTVSIASNASTATAKGKRKAAPRAKATKSKRAKTTKAGQKATEDGDTQELETRTEVMHDEASQDLNTQESELQRTPTQTEVLQELPHPAPTQQKADVEQNVEVEEEQSPIVGPPEKDATPIPAVAPSPIKEQRRSPRVSSPLPNPTVEVSTPKSSQSETSDVENAPPSARPESVRPPLSSPGVAQPTWEPVDVELVFQATPVADLFGNKQADLSDSEKQMTVQDWIQHLAEQAEGNLKTEGERVVAIFEREGQQALKVLEGIGCV